MENICQNIGCVKICTRGGPTRPYTSFCWDHLPYCPIPGCTLQLWTKESIYCSNHGGVCPGCETRINIYLKCCGECQCTATVFVGKYWKGRCVWQKDDGRKYCIKWGMIIWVLVKKYRIPRDVVNKILISATGCSVYHAKAIEVREAYFNKRNE
jgi:hypothetical protein